MARRTMSIEAQLRGTTAAIKSKKTPPQLLEGLRRRKTELEKKLRREDQSGRAKQRRFARGFLGLL